jgi:hypothetical protein
VLKTSLRASFTLLLGIVFVMAVKPSAPGSAIALVVPVILGLAWGLVPGAHAQRPSAPQIGPGADSPLERALLVLVQTRRRVTDEGRQAR